MIKIVECESSFNYRTSDCKIFKNELDQSPKYVIFTSFGSVIFNELISYMNEYEESFTFKYIYNGTMYDYKFDDSLIGCDELVNFFDTLLLGTH